MAFEALDFLDGYSQSRQFFLSHPFLWKVQFSYEQRLPSAINNALSKSPDEAWWHTVTQPNHYMRSGNIMVAREMTIPNENSQFDLAGEMNKGGFLPGYAMNKRMNFLEKVMTINFWDTEADIEHLFFRPWMIALGIDGLLTRELICPAVTLIQYNNLMQPRKGYKFVDVFPTNVEGYVLNYDTYEVHQKTVSFAFKNYQPLHGVKSLPVGRKVEPVAPYSGPESAHDSQGRPNPGFILWNDRPENR